MTHHNCKYDWDLYWETIKRWRGDGKTWDRISENIEIPVGAIRAEWDRRDRLAARHELTSIREADIRALKAQRAPDDRDITARFMGDPRPQESALAQKQHDQAQDQEATLMQRLYPLQEQVSGVLQES